MSGATKRHHDNVVFTVLVSVAMLVGAAVMALVLLGFVALLYLVAIFAEFVAPHDPNKRDVAYIHVPPQRVHLLGGETLSIKGNEFQSNEPYAWSWALCKLLDTHPRYRERFRRLGEHLTPRAFAAAFQQSFAADMDDLALDAEILQHAFEQPCILLQRVFRQRSVAHHVLRFAQEMQRRHLELGGTDQRSLRLALHPRAR